MDSEKKENANLSDLSELRTQLLSSLKEQFNLRVQQSVNRDSVKSHLFKKVRRTIASIKTKMHQIESKGN